MPVNVSAYWPDEVRTELVVMVTRGRDGEIQKYGSIHAHVVY